jgi:nucleoside-diphosphate-sugar epimerase
MTNILILGGTAWLGAATARAALALGHRVTCLARGSAGDPPAGAEFIQVDRREPGGYAAVANRDWDLVVEISWQPGLVREAAETLAPRAAAWVMVSSVSVYAANDVRGADESDPLLPAFDGDVAGVEEYGEAKVACEAITLGATAGRAMLARAGLIGGDGAGSDRTGYWPGRFALARSGESRHDPSILVPDDPDGSVQMVDVLDLADFLLSAGLSGRAGPVNVVGEATPFPEVLDRADSLSAADGASVRRVVADAEWLAAQQVSPWAGPRSLPLWVPGPDAVGLATRSDQRSLDWGLRRRPLANTLAGALDYERRRGLDRDRRAGVSVSEERALIAKLVGS